MRFLRKLTPFLLILILSIFAILPLLNTGFFTMHDDTQPTRVFEMSQALKDLQIPVRWTRDLGFGFGYPIFNYYAPLSYYFGAGFNLLGLDVLLATKLMMILGIVASGVFMYLFVKEIFGRFPGVLAALLYLYAPYHAVDIYVRGDVTEFYAYAFIPLLFYGLYKLYLDNKFSNVLIPALALAGVTLSHNLTALMMFPFAILFSIYLIIIKKQTLVNFVLAFFFGLLLSAFYFIPALVEINYTNVISQVGGGADYKDHFVCLNQLWSSSWGFGGSVKGCYDGISYMVGKYHLIFSALSLILLLVLGVFKKLDWLRDLGKISLILVFVLFSLISVFFMLDISNSWWALLKPMEYFQYPWRFLIITTFSLSLVASSLLWVISKLLKNNSFYLVAIVICGAVIILNLKFFQPQYINYKTASDYTAVNKIEWEISKISKEYMPKKFILPASADQVANLNNIKNVKVNSVIKKTGYIKFDVTLDKDMRVTFPVAYFPAWKAYIDDKEVIISESRKGMDLNIDKGSHEVVFDFKQTQIELISSIMSLSGLILLIIGIIYFRLKR